MKGKNRVIVRGNLTGKPVMRYTKAKDPVAWFIVASNYPVRSADGSGWEKAADFIPVLCFRKTAELAEKYLDKGSAVECEGKLKNRERDDNGKRTYELIFTAFDITLLGRTKTETPAESESEKYQEDEPVDVPEMLNYFDYTSEEINQAIAAKNPATYE